jgi:hypothetical protein
LGVFSLWRFIGNELLAQGEYFSALIALQLLKSPVRLRYQIYNTVTCCCSTMCTQEEGHAKSRGYFRGF